MKPHAWSHACTSVDSLGHVVVVINGLITHDISNLQSMQNLPQNLKSHLILGAAWFQAPKLTKFQSEASVTNVNNVH